MRPHAPPLLQVSRLLRQLHAASLAAGKHGPAWLPYNQGGTLVEQAGQFVLTGRALGEIVSQLEDDGLVVRKHGLFRCGLFTHGLLRGEMATHGQ